MMNVHTRVTFDFELILAKFKYGTGGNCEIEIYVFYTYPKLESFQFINAA